MIYKEDDPDVRVLQDIIMIGYPSGVWDKVNNLPISRRGITATSPQREYNGKKEFLIDMACWQGSSGSPILLYNEGVYTVQGKVFTGTRLNLVGILYGLYELSIDGEIVKKEIPSSFKLLPSTHVPINLGIAISAQQLYSFKEIIQQQTKNIYEQ